MKSQKLINITRMVKPYSEHTPVIQITQTENLKHDIVHIITRLFQEGDIEVLIGTKSLLGEGWDAPAIKALILVSFVVSFVLSNSLCIINYILSSFTSFRMTKSYFSTSLDASASLSRTIGVHFAIMHNGFIQSNTRQSNPYTTKQSRRYLTPLISLPIHRLLPSVEVMFFQKGEAPKKT